MGTHRAPTAHGPLSRSKALRIFLFGNLCETLHAGKMGQGAILDEDCFIFWGKASLEFRAR